MSNTTKRELKRHGRDNSLRKITGVSTPRSNIASDSFERLISVNAIESGTISPKSRGLHVYLIELRCVFGPVLHKIGVSSCAAVRFDSFCQQFPPVGPVFCVGMAVIDRQDQTDYEAAFCIENKDFHVWGEWFLFPDCRGNEDQSLLQRLREFKDFRQLPRKMMEESLVET